MEGWVCIYLLDPVYIRALADSNAGVQEAKA